MSIRRCAGVTQIARSPPSLTNISHGHNQLIILWCHISFKLIFLRVLSAKLIGEPEWCPAVNRDFPRSASQVIRSYWKHLWCSRSAECNQSAGSLYNGGELQFLPLSGLCDFREWIPSVGFLWFLLKSENLSWGCLSFGGFFCSFGQFPYILMSDWHFTFGFWVQSFCSSVTLPRGPVCFDPFCDLCIALLVSQPDSPPHPHSHHVFWRNTTMRIKKQVLVLSNTYCEGSLPL